MPVLPEFGIRHVIFIHPFIHIQKLYDILSIPYFFTEDIWYFYGIFCGRAANRLYCSGGPHGWKVQRGVFAQTVRSRIWARRRRYCRGCWAAILSANTMREDVSMDEIQKTLLMQVADLHAVPAGAYCKPALWALSVSSGPEYAHSPSLCLAW